MTMQLFADKRTGATRAVRAGDLVFIGGLMATGADGRIVAGGVREQAKVIFDALVALVAEAGASMADVVKHNVYFSCEGDGAAVRTFIADLDDIRIPYFSNPGPTTTEIRCGLDREGALLLVDAWVVVGGRKELLSPPNHWSWKTRGPFVHGWKVGDMLFVGGQRSLDAHGNVLGTGDIEIQTEEAFRNLDTMLRAGGGDRHSLMRQNTYFRFFGEGREVTEYWEKMTAVRRRYMSVPSAAGAGLRITGFPNAEELIQVEGIGMLGDVKQRLQPENHWDWSISNSQFTQGWKIGKMAFIGGQISADNKAQAVGADLATQTRNVFQFIRNVLAEGGLDETDVAKLYVYYHAEGDWAAIEAARKTVDAVQAEFYPAPGPAVTAIRVSGFAFENLLVEIEAMAVTRD